MVFENYKILEEFFADNFQHDIVVMIGDEKIYEGKFLLFNIKSFSYGMIIKNPQNQKKTVLLPFPFKIKVLDKNILQLDYTNNTLFSENPELLKSVNLFEKSYHGNKNVFYNSTPIISASE